MELAARIVWSLAAAVNVAWMASFYVKDDTNGMIFSGVLAIISVMCVRSGKRS